MNNLAVYFPRLEAVSASAQPIFRVTVGGRPRPDLYPVACEQRLGAAPRLRLAMSTGQAPGGAVRQLPEMALRAIGPDELVTVDLLRSGTLALRGSQPLDLFEGYIDGPAFAYGAAAEEAGFWAVDRSEALLAARVAGQFQADDAGSRHWLSGADLAFNPDGRPNMSPTDQGGPADRPGRLFTVPGGAEAEFWTADQAANYLISCYAAADWLSLPTRSELTPLFGDHRLENLRLEGRTVAAALEELGRRRGLRVSVALARSAAGELVRSLILTGPGLGRPISLYHQMPGETFSLARTVVEKAEVEIQWSQSLAQLELGGDVKIFESTFELRPGWDPEQAGQPRESYRRGGNPGFSQYAEVYRKWVLNETGDYSDEPWNAGPAYDFGPLFGEPAMKRRRRLLPTISTDAAGESFGVYVEISYDDGESYARYAGPVAVLRDECGIYLSSDQLPPELFYAADRDLLKVRVTAAVESDARLTAVAARPGLQADHRGRRLWLDVSRDYHYRQVTSGSRFAGQDSQAVDDSERLLLLAADLWQSQSQAPAPCRITLPFFSVSYRLGDAIDAIRYRWAWLKRRQGGAATDPLVVAVRQTLGPQGWRTELELS